MTSADTEEIMTSTLGGYMRKMAVASALVIAGGMVFAGGASATTEAKAQPSSVAKPAAKCAPKFSNAYIKWKSNRGMRLEPRYGWRLSNCEGRVVKAVTTFTWYAADGSRVDESKNDYFPRPDQSDTGFSVGYYNYLNRFGNSWFLRSTKNSQQNIRTCMKDGIGRNINLSRNTFIMEVTAYDQSGAQVTSFMSKAVRCGKSLK